MRTRLIAAGVAAALVLGADMDRQREIASGAAYKEGGQRPSLRAIVFTSCTRWRDPRPCPGDVRKALDDFLRRTTPALRSRRP
jgi:hypothetical protein